MDNKGSSFSNNAGVGNTDYFTAGNGELSPKKNDNPEGSINTDFNFTGAKVNGIFSANAENGITPTATTDKGPEEVFATNNPGSYSLGDIVSVPNPPVGPIKEPDIDTNSKASASDLARDIERKLIGGGNVSAAYDEYVSARQYYAETEAK